MLGLTCAPRVHAAGVVEFTSVATAVSAARRCLATIILSLSSSEALIIGTNLGNKRGRSLVDKERANVLPKSLIGAAFTYALNQWQALLRYTTQGYLNIDNNSAEQALRAVAIGRKNYLFFGSDVGGKTAAVWCRRASVWA